MRDPLLVPDRALLLLSIVPYLREHGPTPVIDLAAAFNVDPKMLRRLVSFLGTAGVPGETLSYQDEDLFDIDWDALEQHDIADLTRTVVVDDAPRFSPAETAALIAGLQALTTMLDADDAALARSTADKLGAALGAGEAAPALTVTAEPQDPHVPVLLRALEAARTVTFAYRGAAGAIETRSVDPISLRQSASLWYLRAYCHDREAERTFRLDRMSELTIGDPVARRAQLSQSERDDSFELIVRASERALPRLAGFEPEVIDRDADGAFRLRIEAWHAEAAVRIVQFAPGEVTVEAPATARDAVRAWASRALASGASSV